MRNHQPDLADRSADASFAPGRRVAHGGTWLALASSLASAAVTVIGKWNLEAISPLLMIALIFSIAACAFTLVLTPRLGARWLYRHSPVQWFWVGMLGLSSVGALWGFWAGVRTIDPSLAGFINRVEVFVAVLLAMLFLRERFTAFEAAGAVVSILGIVIMRLTLRVEYTGGFWLVLLGSVFFGVVEYVSKVAIRHVDPAVLTGLRSWFMAAAFWIIFLTSGETYTGLGRVWPGVVALALLGPVAARMFYLWALRRMDLARTAIISQIQPVFVVLLAFVALGQLPTVREAWGGVLIMAGCTVMILARPRASSGTTIPVEAQAGPQKSS